MILQKYTLDFLNRLAKNNNRDWFAEHKAEYEKAHENMLGFTEALRIALNQHDKIETPSAKKALKRIYRDTRFSKDKTPYKQHWAGSFMREGAERRGSFYFRFSPQEAFLAGGFWGPNPADLFAIRRGISLRFDEYLECINQANFRQHFGQLKGEQLKTCPKGFDKEDPALEQLRFKQFLLSQPIPKNLWFSNELIPFIVEGHTAMIPYFNLMTEFLNQDNSFD